MTAKIHFGTAGWEYKDWIGPFYPKNMDRTHHLKFYTNYFNFVEINSTFYKLPSIQSVETWYSSVPDNFQFLVKVWSDITHKLGNDIIFDKMDEFLYTTGHLKEKLYGYLLQFPPWFKYSEKHELKLKNFLKWAFMNPSLKFFIELRDNSWFNSEILSQFIDGKNSILVTTYMPKLSAFFLQDQKSYYIRLIGDRELTVFNRIQRTQDKVIQGFSNKIKEFQRDPKIHEIFIIVNNHFAGFAPETVNQLKRKLDLPIISFSSQKKLSDYY